VSISSSTSSAAPQGSATDLINLQQFAGGFPLTQQLAQFAGKPLASLEAAMASADVSPAAGDVARQLWAVALALAIFEQRFAASSDAWQMVAEKARTFALGLYKQAGLTDRKQARLRLSQLVDAAKAAL
jgi:hypothetical protein